MQTSYKQEEDLLCYPRMLQLWGRLDCNFAIQQFPLARDFGQPLEFGERRERSCAHAF
jgi:hypothetical protein